jgi:hypothetical protein
VKNGMITTGIAERALGSGAALDAEAVGCAQPSITTRPPSTSDAGGVRCRPDLDWGRGGEVIAPDEKILIGLTRRWLDHDCVNNGVDARRAQSFSLVSSWQRI